MSGLNAFLARGEGQGIWVTGTWAIGLGNSTFTVICPPIEMKPLHPVIKYSLVGIISVILFAPVVKNLTIDAGKEAKDAAAQARRFMEETRKSDSEQNNNR